MMTLIIVDGGGGGGGGVTWNPADKSSDIALSGGDLIATKINSVGVEAVRATTGISSGARYFEVVVDETGGTGGGEYILIGIANSSFPITGGPGQDTNSYGYYQDTGEKYYNNVLSAFGGTYKTNGDVIGVAYDADAGEIYWSLNGTWQGSGDPSTNTNPAFTGITGTMYPCVSLYRDLAPTQQVTGHFAAADLVYSPPTGFVAWE